MKYSNMLQLALIIIFSSIITNAQMENKAVLYGKVFTKIVVDDKDSMLAIANAKILVVGFSHFKDSLSYATTSDADGNYRIEGLKPGMYFIYVKAEGYAALNLRGCIVMSGENLINLILKNKLDDTGTVMGNVAFTGSGKPIKNALIQLINGNMKMHAAFFAKTDADGNYEADVPEGKYYVICFLYKPDSIHFYEVFYENAHSFGKAKVITVVKGEVTAGVNFSIPDSVTEERTVIFKGKVTDELNTPLANAEIKVWSALKLHHTPKFIKTRTDSDGNYSLTLRLRNAANAFIAGAFKRGYWHEFYLNKDKFYEADILTALSDTVFTDINFTLTKKVNEDTLSISGTVTSELSIGIDNCFVVAQKIASHKMYMAVTDSNGNYKLEGLAEGKYHLLFVASGYLPEFYDNVYRWEEAAVINLTGSITGLDVQLEVIPDLNANGTISGTINAEGGAAIAGAVVTLTNSAGVAVDYSVTDNSGAFSVSGMTAGEYKVTISKYPYKSTEESIMFDPNAGSTQLKEYETTGSTTAAETGKNIIPQKFVLENNYPNPFNPSTKIQFGIPQNGLVKLTIYNVIGEKVAEPVNEILSAGYHTVTFNAHGISSGVYFYRLEANNFVQVKKMIFQK